MVIRAGYIHARLVHFTVPGLQGAGEGGSWPGQGELGEEGEGAEFMLEAVADGALLQGNLHPARALCIPSCV